MTPEQIVKALDRYLAFYTEGESVEADESKIHPQQFPSSEQNPTEEGAVQHALWMCHEAKKFAHASPAKAMRWLCFIQGVLWAADGWTIDEFKADNRAPN